MKINEISDEDKLFLKLKSIKYEFSDSYDLLSEVFSIIGKSRHRRNVLLGAIDPVLNDISAFLREGFAANDPDVIAATDIYNKLQHIRDSL